MVRIYLKADAKIENGACEGFKVKHDGDGFPYVEREGMTVRTPEKLQPHIQQITFVSHFLGTPHRTLGEYRKGETRAYLDKKARDELTLTMIGQKLEEMFELYTAIRAGSVAPTVSWEAEQKPAA